MDKEKIDRLEHAGVKGMKWGRRKNRLTKEQKTVIRQKKLRVALNNTSNLNDRSKIWNELMKNSGNQSNAILRSDLERLRIENGIRQELRTMASHTPKGKLHVAKSIARSAGNLPATVLDPKANPNIKLSQYLLIKGASSISGKLARKRKRGGA